jgi:molecular chaperone HtpG
VSQQTYTFQAEIKQLLNILVHSLYSDREIFLRELISNASDALNRARFEMLTNRDVVDPDAELYIEVKSDEEAGTITVSDTGVGMTAEDMVNNLGVIARSGAKTFIEAMKEGASDGSGGAQDIIGQFGVGFYSAFMVADKVRVVSRSYVSDTEAVAWESDGGDEYVIEPAERESRGTDVILYLKEEDKEFLRDFRLKQIVRTHSDYVTFPIYVAGDEEATNKQVAIWRRPVNEVEDQEYTDFYKMLTMDFNEPLHRITMRADVPLQFYTLLYVPSSSKPNMFSPRKEPGLKLYARKVLIQEYAKDLLPEWLNFVQGVVDSEDLPLNVSRETIQANRVMVNLKKTITNKVLNELKRLARKKPDAYLHIYEQFGRVIKQGLTVDPTHRTDIEPLLFFVSTHNDDPEDYHSLDDYVERMVDNQNDIYYIMGDDFHSARRSPHLDAFRQRGIEVLYFTDPVDAVMIMGLPDYKGHKLRNVDEADIDLNEVGDVEEEVLVKEPLADESFEVLKERFESVLGERVQDVRVGENLVGSAARLVSDDANAGRQMFRINRLLERDYELPVKILEINPRHPLLHNLDSLIGQGNTTLVEAVIEQVFETALLQDGIHPDPAAMATRITLLMQAATGSDTEDLDFADAPTVEAPPPAPEMDFGLDGLGIEDADFVEGEEPGDDDEPDQAEPDESEE